MSCLKNCYNPNPTRVWSRVQNECSYNLDTINNISEKETNQMLLKSNILQYKKNSSGLSKKQIYSLISQAKWKNRKKSWSTQTDTYTNPNTSSLKRVNAVSVEIPNGFINPFDCSINTLLIGGNLHCNTIVNPCTNEIIRTCDNSNLCFPTTDSNVPGKIEFLCWNNNIQTWYPRNRYKMGTSGNKWPQGYKGLLSAIQPKAPTLSYELNYDIEPGVIILKWNNDSTSSCFNNNEQIIYDYIIYLNGQPIRFISNKQSDTYMITYDTTYKFYVRSKIDNILSPPSNIENITTLPLYDIYGDYSIYQANGYTGIVFTETSQLKYILFYYKLKINMLIIAGGAGGNSNGAGGGGGIYYESFNTFPGSYKIQVGGGGIGTNNYDGQNNGNNSIVTYSENTSDIKTYTTTGGTCSINIQAPLGGGYYINSETITYNGGNGSITNSNTNGNDSFIPFIENYKIYLPFIANDLYVSGGGGGGEDNSNKGGGAGYGIGGKFGIISNGIGNSAKQSINDYGFGGGGGGSTSNNGGNGGNGTVIFYWESQ